MFSRIFRFFTSCSIFLLTMFSLGYGQDNILTVGDQSGVPGSTNNIVSITLENNVNVTGLQLTLTYDADRLSANDVSATSRSDNMTIFLSNEPTPGEIILVISDLSSNVIPAGSGSIADIAFDVDQAAAPGNVDLTLSNVVLSDPDANPLPVTTDDGVFTIIGNGTDEPPTVLNPIDDVEISEDAENTIIDLTNVFDDVDNDNALITKSVQANDNPPLVFAYIDGNELTLALQPNQTGTANITIRGTSNGKYIDDIFQITVTAEDDAPTIYNPIPDVNAFMNDPNTIINLTNVFTDVDNDDNLITKTVVDNSNPTLVSATIDGNTLTLDYLPDQYGQAIITIRGTSNGLTVDDDFEVTVTDSDIDFRKQDSLALVAFYNSTNGQYWIDNTNWLSGERIDYWYGITVSNGRVVSISLYGNNLIGTIPVEIGNLSYIEILSVGQNNLIDIPSEIGKLSNLEDLIIYQNNIMSIPPEIGNLEHLKHLNVGRNNLTSVPPEIGNLDNLEILYLYYNNLTSIPSEIGNLENLDHLDIGGNNLTSVPPEIENIDNLGLLYLYRNNLTGSIPDFVFNLTNLRYFSVFDNDLSGEISNRIANLTNLTTLNLSMNNFEGEIPEEIGKLINLRNLRIDNNLFSGSVPGIIANLDLLINLDVSSNKFDNLPDLSALPTLTELYANDNNFTFEDIEPNIGINTFIYSPQSEVGSEDTISISSGATITLSVNVGGTANLYQWYRYFTEIPNANQNVYTLNNVNSNNEAIYTCRITNSIATELILYSNPILVSLITSIDDEITHVPDYFLLEQNFPNPFNPNTNIRFALPQEEHVRIEVYNTIGVKVKTLLDNNKRVGYHTIDFNAQNMPSGVYFYRIEAGVFQDVKKMILIR